MIKTFDSQHIEINQLITELHKFKVQQGVTVEEMAVRLKFSKAYLDAIFQGKRDIREMPITGFRKISTLLGIPCLSALIMAGSLSVEDFVAA
jgi:transcriptional regulator with XRE-family HTH domain